MKGKGFLKVTGILLIIGGAIGLIFGLIAIFGSLALGSIGGAESATFATVILIAALVAIVGSVLELIAGIIGVKNCDKPEKATTCIVWGFIVLVLQIISIILSLSGTPSALSVIITIIFGIALPVLYLIGAFLNKKSA